MIKHLDIVKDTAAKQFLAKEVLAYSALPDEALQMLLDSFEYVAYKKNQVIIRSKETANHLYFIYKGIVRVYYKVSGIEIIDWFAAEGTFFGSMFNYITKEYSENIYESVGPVELMRIKNSDLDNLFREFPEIENAALKMLEQHYLKYIQNVHAVKSLPAEEKYRIFAKHTLGFISRIPLKYVANYLSITQETLSRIRSKAGKFA